MKSTYLCKTSEKNKQSAFSKKIPEKVPWHKPDLVISEQLLSSVLVSHLALALKFLKG